MEKNDILRFFQTDLENKIWSTQNIKLCLFGVDCRLMPFDMSPRKVNQLNIKYHEIWSALIQWGRHSAFYNTFLNNQLVNKEIEDNPLLRKKVEELYQLLSESYIDYFNCYEDREPNSMLGDMLRICYSHFYFGKKLLAESFHWIDSDAFKSSSEFTKRIAHQSYDSGLESRVLTYNPLLIRECDEAFSALGYFIINEETGKTDFLEQKESPIGLFELQNPIIKNVVGDIVIDRVVLDDKLLIYNQIRNKIYFTDSELSTEDVGVFLKLHLKNATNKIQYLSTIKNLWADMKSFGDLPLKYPRFNWVRTIDQDKIKAIETWLKESEYYDTSSKTIISSNTDLFIPRKHLTNENNYHLSNVLNDGMWDKLNAILENKWFMTWDENGVATATIDNEKFDKSKKGFLRYICSLMIELQENNCFKRKMQVKTCCTIMEATFGVKCSQQYYYDLRAGAQHGKSKRVVLKGLINELLKAI